MFISLVSFRSSQAHAAPAEALGLRSLLAPFTPTNTLKLSAERGIAKTARWNGAFHGRNTGVSLAGGRGR